MSRIMNFLVIFVLVCELAAGLFAAVFFRQPMGLALIACSALAGIYLFYESDKKEK